ncbi:MAG: hypothetical protein KC486_02445, partial [Myxococcales bacterium]|nr:hypothetical protein [Myxococcales bacterium]
LDNAIRFGEGGAITLRAREVDGHVQIAVGDHGIGMTEDQRAKIFDAFSQADDSPTRQYGGMGIGLAIVHRLCALMGGSIDVDSELGVGSTFTVDVPLVVEA